MATTNGKIAVTTTAIKLVELDNVTQYVHLHSKGATYLGNAGVTTTNGFLLDNGDKLVITVPQGCELWIVGSGSAFDLYYLTTRVD
jgi:hypothetical protein